MLEHAEDVLAASMMAQTLCCCLERKYLGALSAGQPPVELADCTPRGLFRNISWIKITQVGRPVNDGPAVCLGYIRKMLMACALPDMKLTFLVVGDGVKCDMYLGLRDNGTQQHSMKHTVDTLDNFVKICWPGLRTQRIDGEDATLRQYFQTVYRQADVFTGIPTPADAAGEGGNTTVEHLIGGMRGRKFAYLVTAVPVEASRLDDVLAQCREMAGQLESAKTINISKSVQVGASHTYSKAHTETTTWSHTEGMQCRDYKKAAGNAMLGAGVMMAAAFLFPPAVAVLPCLKGALAAAAVSAAPLSTFLGLSGMSGMNTLMGFVPSKNQSDTHGGSFSDTVTTSDTTTRSTSETVSRTLVNKHVEAACKQIETYTKRLELARATGAWHVDCCLLTDEPDRSGAWQLKSMLTGGESALEPVRAHDVSHLMGKLHGTAKPYTFMVRFKGQDTLFHHPFGDDFSQLTTLLTTRELSAMVNFPLHSVPGLNVVDSAPEFSLTPQRSAEGFSIDIGRLLYGGSASDIGVRLPLDTLSRHALVCGVNGSGKTNTVLAVLDGMAAAGRPFMVIEPAKTEYVDWAAAWNSRQRDPRKHIRIFIPGCERYARTGLTPDKLRLNPFEVPALPDCETRLLSHIDRLKAIFAAAFPMQDILPVIMEHLLYDLYGAKLAGGDKAPFPRLADVNRRFIDNLMENIGYARENTQNITAALRTRFASLKQGWKGELLDNPALTGMSWDELFGAPVVLNLSYAGDDQDRAFVMALVLQMLYEWRIAESEAKGFSFDAGKCRHLVVVEEAHRVMGRNDNTETPQYKSAMMFSNFLSEVRAYGQGMMVVDQVPARLIDDAVKNTNVKIIHKLVAADDARHVAECIGLTDEQRKVIAKLSVGQAVLAGLNSANVAGDDCADIYLAQINKKK